MGGQHIFIKDSDTLRISGEEKRMTIGGEELEHLTLTDLKNAGVFDTATKQTNEGDEYALTPQVAQKVREINETNREKRRQSLKPFVEQPEIWDDDKPTRSLGY